MSKYLFNQGHSKHVCFVLFCSIFCLLFFGFCFCLFVCFCFCFFLGGGGGCFLKPDSVQLCSPVESPLCPCGQDVRLTYERPGIQIPAFSFSDVIWSVFGLVGPVSVFYHWVRLHVQSTAPITVWQHVKWSEQTRPLDTVCMFQER